MRSFLLAYWIIGCIAAGMVWADQTQQCPNDKTSGVEILSMVAIWPVPIVAVINGARPTKTCGDGSPFHQ